jgi:hypothetical protein
MDFTELFNVQVEILTAAFKEKDWETFSTCLATLETIKKFYSINPASVSVT